MLISYMPNLDYINDIIGESKRKPMLATKLHSELTSSIRFEAGIESWEQRRWGALLPF